MIRILSISPAVTDACSFYRAGGVFPHLEKMIDDLIVHHVQWDRTVLHWQELIRYDLVYMQRPFEAQAVSLAKYLKDLRIPLWVDFDDNLLTLTPDNDKFRLYDDVVRGNIVQIMQHASVVTVTTHELKRQFDQYNKDVRVIPNAFNDFIFKERIIRPGRAQMILWRGGNSHIKDVMLYTEVFEKAMAEFKDWHFLFVGMQPWFLNGSMNLYEMPAKDVIHYFTNMKEILPALVTVPLDDTIFNRCKSNIAYVEASYFGAVTLAPAWEEWKDLPGILTYTDNASFYEGIRKIATLEVNAAEQGLLAWNYVRENLGLKKINVKRIELINELL